MFHAHSFISLKERTILVPTGIEPIRNVQKVSLVAREAINPRETSRAVIVTRPR